MPWFWTILFLSFAFSYISEGNNKHHSKASAVVIGTVYCDTCFQHKYSPKTSHFIQGASIAVECSSSKFREEVKTNKHGEFQVHLPFSISKHVNKINRCSVKLISSNKPYCAVAAAATSSRLHLKSRKKGTHIFSAGFFTFRPLKQPELCDEKSLSPNSNPNDPAFLPPIQDPPIVGRILPPLPGIPFLPPIPKKETAKASELSNKRPEAFGFPPNPFNPPSIFPPNPFQPPPSVIPPVIPSPPPSIFPPIFPSPSPPPFFQLPPIPGLTPSSPPPPPAFIIPLPPFPFPFPFQPPPGFPGVPPAEVSSSSKTSFP